NLVTTMVLGFGRSRRVRPQSEWPFPAVRAEQGRRFADFGYLGSPRQDRPSWSLFAEAGIRHMEKKNNQPLHDDVPKTGIAEWLKRGREGGQGRKSPWNLLVLAVAFAAIGSIGYVLFRIMWQIHVVIYPAHSGRLGEFWTKGTSFWPFVSSFLLLVPLC